MIKIISDLAEFAPRKINKYAFISFKRKLLTMLATKAVMSLLLCFRAQEAIRYLSVYQSIFCGQTWNKDRMLTKSSPDRLSGVTLAPYIIMPWLIHCSECTSSFRHNTEGKDKTGAEWWHLMSMTALMFILWMERYTSLSSLPETWSAFFLICVITCWWRSRVWQRL